MKTYLLILNDLSTGIIIIVVQEMVNYDISSENPLITIGICFPCVDAHKNSTKPRAQVLPSGKK
jgi:hypothetical protein